MLLKIAIGVEVLLLAGAVLLAITGRALLATRVAGSVVGIAAGLMIMICVLGYTP